MFWACFLMCEIGMAIPPTKVERGTSMCRMMSLKRTPEEQGPATTGLSRTACKERPGPGLSQAEVGW